MEPQVVEVLMSSGVTHILFPYREDMPLCFLTLKPGRGTKDRDGVGNETGVAELDPQVPHPQHGCGL